MSNLSLTKYELVLNSGHNTITSKIPQLSKIISAHNRVSVCIDSTEYVICKNNLDSLLFTIFKEHGFVWLYDMEVYPDIYKIDFCNSAYRFIKKQMRIEDE